MIKKITEIQKILEYIQSILINETLYQTIFRKGYIKCFDIHTFSEFLNWSKNITINQLKRSFNYYKSKLTEYLLVYYGYGSLNPNPKDKKWDVLLYQFNDWVDVKCWYNKKSVNYSNNQGFLKTLRVPYINLKTNITKYINVFQTYKIINKNNNYYMIKRR